MTTDRTERIEGKTMYIMQYKDHEPIVTFCDAVKKRVNVEMKLDIFFLYLKGEMVQQFAVSWGDYTLEDNAGIVEVV